ncbi:hypothetical protein ABID99_005595 [Mucilaginibacter sp. OAE612]|uniref:hypothetical protein n=1 Tax=Mucilaginibacter sp. OAE612 TaxID=3156444 RepID=UPI00359EEF96
MFRLYGVASFMTVQMIKEVSITKVLGATAAIIVYLFKKMHQWLQSYVYRINISVTTICCRRNNCNNYCNGKNGFPANKGGNGQPGDEFWK